MKPAPFEYVRPQSLDEALAVLAEHGDDAKPLAGGQSLIPAMNFRLGQPAVLVDLNDLHELSYIGSPRGGGAGAPDDVPRGDLQIGGMTRQQALERSAVVHARAPLVSETVPHIAHLAIRTRGTIGGSLAHADPAAELPAVAVALEARLHVRSRGGSRSIAADDFFTGLMTTALEPGELLVGVSLPPMPARAGWAFDEIARRRGDYALVGVAAIVTLDDRGRCARARMALLSAGDRPMRADRAAAVLAGQAPTPDAIRAAADAAARDDIDPHGDLHASSAYRRHLASVLTRRALTRAFARAAASMEPA
jgi:carbon-monoxide dehydrogenase medium subunit